MSGSIRRIGASSGSVAECRNLTTGLEGGS